MPVPPRSEGAAPGPLAWVRQAVHDVVDLAWPSTCLGCDAWGEPWCPACRRSLRGQAFTVHPRHAPHLDVVAAEVFDGPLRTAVTAFKDHGRSDGLALLVPPARRALARALVDAPAATTTDGPLVLVPVPSSPAAYRERGRFPLGEITRAVCRSTVLVDGSGVLVHRGRGVKDQAHVGVAERRANVAGAFAVAPRAAARLQAARARVVLFDDVVTTGATLASAHAELTRCGLRPVAVVALAATPRVAP